jgi:hypothetical protein
MIQQKEALAQKVQLYSSCLQYFKSGFSVLPHSYFQAQAARVLKQNTAQKHVEIVQQKAVVVEETLAKDIEELNEIVSNGWVS